MPKHSGLETPREMEIGQRVKRFRDQINWPQPAFAAELGISRDRLASVEYGRTPLRYDVGYRLCFIFDVNPRWLASGEGEVKAATVALEMPSPDGVRRKALWSEISDRERGRATRKEAPAPAKGGKPKKGELIPHFDPTAHVVGFLSDLFAKEKFRSPLERQEFALEVTSYARELSLRIRRERTGERYLAVSGGRAGGEAAAGAETGSARAAGGVFRLRADIRGLEQRVKALNAAIEKGSAGLPRPGESEVNRLQNAVEKIAAQIDATAAALKILLGRRAT